MASHTKYRNKNATSDSNQFIKRIYRIKYVTVAERYKCCFRLEERVSAEPDLDPLHHLAHQQRQQGAAGEITSFFPLYGLYLIHKKYVCLILLVK